MMSLANASRVIVARFWSFLVFAVLLPVPVYVCMGIGLPLWATMLAAAAWLSIAISVRALWPTPPCWQSASSAGAVTVKPWGSELLWARTARYAGKVLRVRRSEALSLQYHRVKDETLMVLSGRVRLEHYARGGDSAALVLGPWEVFHVPPGLWHRIVALEDAEVLEVSSPELDDVVRLEDRYGRAKA